MIGAAKVVEVIVTDIARRGCGTADDPTRLVKQIWTLDGQLILEVDCLDGRSIVGEGFDDLGEDTRP